MECKAQLAPLAITCGDGVVSMALTHDGQVPEGMEAGQLPAVADVRLCLQKGLSQQPMDDIQEVVTGCLQE